MGFFLRNTAFLIFIESTLNFFNLNFKKIKYPCLKKIKIKIFPVEKLENTTIYKITGKMVYFINLFQILNICDTI